MSRPTNSKQLAKALRAAATSQRASRQSGFSLIEVLIGALLLAFIVLGVLPLMTRAAIQNVDGAEATLVSNFAKSEAEEIYQLPFNHPRASVPPGSDELETINYWNETSHEWEAAPPATDPWVWQRTTRVRQFNIGDIADGTLDTALDGGEDVRFVQIKEIQVELESRRDESNPLSGGRPIIIRTLKAF